MGTGQLSPADAGPKALLCVVRMEKYRLYVPVGAIGERVQSESLHPHWVISLLTSKSTRDDIVDSVQRDLFVTQ